MRAWSGALVVVLLLLPGAATAKEPDAAMLFGTNVITSDGSSRLDVRLDSDAIIDLTSGDSPDAEWSPEALKVQGDAKRFLGFVLTERDTTDGFLAVALRTPAPIRDGDRVHTGLAYGQLAVQDRATSGEAACVRCPIPAGNYHLYVLSDEATTVTLKVEGLGGRSNLSTGNRIHPWASSHEPHEFDVNLAGGGGHWTAMGSFPDEAGLFISTYQLAVASSAPIGALASDCHGSGDVEHCQDHVLVGNGDAVGGMRVLTSASISDGVHAGMDYNIVGSSEVTAASGLLWVPLDPVAQGAGAKAVKRPKVSFASYLG